MLSIKLKLWRITMLATTEVMAHCFEVLEVKRGTSNINYRYNTLCHLSTQGDVQLLNDQITKMSLWVSVYKNCCFRLNVKKTPVVNKFVFIPVALFYLWTSEDLTELNLHIAIYGMHLYFCSLTGKTSAGNVFRGDIVLKHNLPCASAEKTSQTFVHGHTDRKSWTYCSH